MPMMADVDDLEDNVQGSPFSRDQNCRHSSRSRESPGSRRAGQLNIIVIITTIMVINIIIIVFQLLTRIKLIKNHHNRYHYCRHCLHHSHHQIILAGSIEMLLWPDQSFHWKIKVRHHFLHNGCHHFSPPFVASFTPTQLLVHPLVAIFYIFVNLCTCLKEIIHHNDLSLPAMQALTFFYGLGTDGYWGSVY